MSSALFGIIKTSFCLFILLLNLYEPYSKAFNSDYPSKLITGESIRQKSSWRWQGIGNARKKCLVPQLPQLQFQYHSYNGS